MLQTKPKPCKFCESVKHTAFTCPYRPRKEIVAKIKHCTHCDAYGHLKVHCPVMAYKLTRVDFSKRTSTTLRVSGRYQRQWKKTRDKWLKLHLPTHSGHYQCHYCGLFIPKEEMQIDHKIPRILAPELRFEITNLVASCWNCNGLKASTTHDEYAHTCH